MRTERPLLLIKRIGGIGRYPLIGRYARFTTDPNSDHKR